MSKTIHDVAKKLNISIYVVSRAIDGHTDVSEWARQLVIETANKMGYAPSRAASPEGGNNWLYPVLDFQTL